MKMKNRKFTVEVVENGFLVDEVVLSSEEGPRHKSKIHVFRTVGAMCTYLTKEVQGEFVTDQDEGDAEYWTKRVAIAMLAAGIKIRAAARQGRGWEGLAEALEGSAKGLEDELAHGRPYEQRPD
jgi:hypothetical protein